jgi:tetratricopeptide (TPR) repeat protein
VSLPAATGSAAAPAGRADEIAAANQALAVKYFLEGAELDDGENRDLEAAAWAYRRAALFHPHLVPAIVNLANIHYERDEIVEAEALYEKALRLDGDCFEAYFNIGNIHHDLGRYPEAVVAYRDALAVYTRAEHPVDWATTQNNLAAALQNQGSRTGGAEGTRLLAEAVAAYRDALEVRTRAEHPLHRAMTQENMAIAEFAWAEHPSAQDPKAHLRAALGHVEAALEVYDPENMPYDHGTATRLRERISTALDGSADGDS